ncbi:MAG: hypothetical protein J6K04_06085 [Lachnospiraceae bacterium]|nr:hypothetical protein [Lachnospiraceae bacterium]
MGLFEKIKERSAKSFAVKFAIVVITVVVLGGGVAGTVYAIMVNSAEAVLGRAAAATFITDESALEETFGLQALVSGVTEKGAEAGIEVAIKELPMDVGMGEMVLPNAGVRLTVRTNPAGESNLNIDALVANMPLLSARAYANKEKLQATVPALLQDVFVVNHGSASFQEDIRNCYLVDYVGIPEETLEEILALVPEQTEVTEMLPKEEILGELFRILFSCMIDCFEEVEFKKAGKEELTTGENIRTCKVYSAEVFSGYVREFLNLYPMLTKNYIKELVAEYGVTKEEVDWAFYQLTKAAWFVGGSISDVDVTFYVHGDRLVRMRAEWEAEWYLNPQEGFLELNFADTGNPMENMQLALVLPIHEDISAPEVPERLELTYQVATENTEDGCVMEWKAVCNGEPLELSLQYEKLGGDFTLQGKNSAQSLKITGAVGELEQGKKIGLELEEYVYTEEDYTEEQNLDVSLYVKVLEDMVTPLSGNERDALALTQEDVVKLEEEVTANIYKLMFRMLGLFQ